MDSSGYNRLPFVKIIVTIQRKKQKSSKKDLTGFF